MPSTFHLDFETRSAADLGKWGAYRYASDPTAKILLTGIAKDDGPIYLWDCFDPAGAESLAALGLMEELIFGSGHICYAHNAGFEIAICRYLWEETFGFPPPRLEQWRCTAAMCRITAIPSGLAGAADFLHLPVRKDSSGTKLIDRFCKPNAAGGFLDPSYPKPITVNKVKTTAHAAWQNFREYCRTDVATEREIEKRLFSLTLKGWLLDSFLLDIRMNDRGIPVNVPAVVNAEAIVAEYNDRMGAEFRNLTGYTPTQTAKVLAWLQARGYPADNLQSGTISRVLTGAVIDESGAVEGEVGESELDKMTFEGARALQLRSLLSFAALKKLPAMREAVCPDGKVRGTTTWWGAMRTGRDSSRVIQTQNMRRPTVDNTEEIYAGICEGSLDSDSIEVLYGPPLECVASSIRHFIDPGEGQEFIDVDFSQIEARVLPWLSGHEELLQAFRDNLDLYKITVATTLDKPYAEVTKADRQLGKVIVLAAGYGGGVNAMSAACLMFRVVMDDKEKRAIIKAWRAANKPITAHWREMQDAAVQAIKDPGKWVPAGRSRFKVTAKNGFLCLVMQLPSGRMLSYPWPETKEVFKIRRPKKGAKVPDDNDIIDEGAEVEEVEMVWVDIPRLEAINPVTRVIHDGVWRTDEVSYYGQFKGSNQWGRVRTHGGVFVENECQAVAADFLKLGAIRAELNGYEPVMQVHDQLISYYNKERGDTVDGLVQSLCTLPKWAEDFPLAAVGNLAPFYRKD